LPRREFFGRAAMLSAALGGLSIPAVATPAAAKPLKLSPADKHRRKEAYDCRVDAARLALDRPGDPYSPNGDEQRYEDNAGSYSKGLPHDALGNVDPTAFAALQAACKSGEMDDFEQIPMGGARKLVSPRAGLTFDLEGSDSATFGLAPAPRVASAQAAADLAELYWLAAAREVPFVDYDFNPLIARAAADQSRLTDYRGPRAAGVVTPQTVFRGNTPGDIVGPYISQFLWKDIPMGALPIAQKIQTAVPGLDYVTNAEEWLAIQNGQQPATAPVLDSTRRYVRNLRDMTRWVYMDALYQEYHQACLILLAVAPTTPGLPYRDSYTQEGFATFGAPHVLTLVTEVATRALKTVWFQKWMVHRRLRPEAMGGLVHQTITGTAVRPVHADILGSDGPQEAYSRYGSYLLPQAFPEGSPLHPSYGSGHATVAGACVTVLKAWFDESFVLPDPVVADASGLSLLPYNGPDLTVGNELNKLAGNIAIGRNAAGIHYRSDYWESVRLGERVALALLEEQQLTYNEEFAFTLTTFDGERVTL
jgi:hypothetical protein